MLKLENGHYYNPKNSDVIECSIHDFKTTWGALGPIEKLAVEEGLDCTGDRCLLDRGGR